MRNYHEDDIKGLIDLYNSSPIKGAYFVRNESFLRHFIRYPGVEDGILVAEKDGGIEGIAIVSMGDKKDLNEGKIVELRAKNASTTGLLIQKALQYCRDKGADIVFVRPPIHEDTGKVFDSWIKVDSGVMMLKPLSLLPLLKALLDAELVKKNYIGKSLVFILDEELIGVEVAADGVQIGQLNGTFRKSAIVVAMSSKTALEILFGWTSPYTAYLARRLKIRGLGNVLGVLRLLCSLRIKAPWNVALIDEV